ncbi:hypothetical protein PLESTF_001628700 [Pleodorina starrii]|nr:hypothetical protein PLESTM_001168600 [Pleodorina starrii]GLC75369.1 hypothetical protein PLESTF_001628700 [Pleodorina starrii]
MDGMQYKDVGAEDEGVSTQTAFREAEKKYQLFRERIMKMKRTKKRAGKLRTRPIDMSEVLDLHGRPSDLLPAGVLRHIVQGYDGPVYTFARHPGLVFMPGALPPPQRLELTTAALMDYPEPPARTNHALHYGPLPGLWRAAQMGLRLNWGRRDVEQPAGCGGQACGHSPARPQPCHSIAAAPQDPAGSLGAGLAAAVAALSLFDPDQNLEYKTVLNPDPDTETSGSRSGAGGAGSGGCSAPGQGDGREQGQGRPCCSGPRGTGEAQMLCSGGGAWLAGEASQQQQRGDPDPDLASLGTAGSRGRCGAGEAGGGADSAAALQAADLPGEDVAQGAGRNGDGCSSSCCSRRSSSSSGAAAAAAGWRSHRSSGSGSDCVGAAAEKAPAFEECWSADGPGPPAEQLLRRLRWATLGPQFEWTERRYDFTGVFRPLPPSLETLAKQLAAVVERLQDAGLEVLPAAAADGGYKPDAAIVNYYQQGDVLGGHLDDVERDMAQPIVSVSLGCPAIFLMGGPTKHHPPSAILVRDGDVMVLAGEARRCYHGVPRILEAEPCGHGCGEGSGGGQKAAEGGGGAPVGTYTRCARINISIRAVA